HGHHRHLHPFPTRRSSDLECSAGQEQLMRRDMRRAITGLACVVLSTGIVAMATQPVKIDFEKDEVGKAPRAFSFALTGQGKAGVDRKSTRLNSSHVSISYA